MNEYASLIIDGSELEVTALQGREGISMPFEFDITGRMEAGAARAEQWSGATCSLILKDAFGNTRTLEGVAAEAEALIYEDGAAIVTVKLAPAAHMLRLGRDCRYFLEKTVVDIVSEVLGGVSHRWELSESYAVRNYTVQYREDDWTFVSRLLEQEGIFYWFDHTAGSQLVLSDDASGAPDLVGGALLPFHYDTGMTRGDAEVVEEIGDSAYVAPGKFTVHSFDPNRPDLAVTGSVGTGPLEFYDAPGGGPTEPAESMRQATIMSQASYALAHGVNGETTSGRVEPGRVLALEHHPLGQYNARFLVTRVYTEITQRRRSEIDERPLKITFEGIRDGVPYREPRRTPPAQQAGLQAGAVWGPNGEEIHPDDRGRVRVRLHWDRTVGEGWWMRVAQRGANDSMQIPRIGWNVQTFNDEGSVDAPSVLARILDAEHPPPYALPANKTRVVFKTATSPSDGSNNEIYFEDMKGAEQMFINASKDMNVLAQRTKSENVMRDHTRQVGNNHTLTVQASRKQHVDGNQDTKIGGNEVLEIGGSNTENVTGDMSISIGGNRNINVGSAHSIDVKEDRTLNVGAALIDTSLGDMSANGGRIKSLIVGGVDARIAKQSVTQQSGGIGLWTIGGLKARISGKDQPTDVQKELVEIVGGLFMCKTDGKYNDASTETQHWKSGAFIKGDAPEIKLEATESIELVCGAAVITIYPDRIEGSAPSLDLTKSSDVVVNTGIIKHN